MMAKKTGGKVGVLGGEWRSAYMRERDAATAGNEGKAARPSKSYRVPLIVRKFAVWLDPAVVEPWRDAVDCLSGPPERLTLSRFVQSACDAELKRLARKHRGGRAFPKRTGPLKRGGRPKL